MMNTKFSGLREEGDPLVGDHVAIPGCPGTGHVMWSQDGAPKIACPVERNLSPRVVVPIPL
ncbi:MAG: hypothetical protein M3Q89_13160, partial [Verrucomicrobiota bacterium]|nr:hypothetical protein [Verrucomicrobiota bacterium]